MVPLNIEVAVAAVRPLTPRIREYLLRSVDGAPLPRSEPGAHVELHTVSPTSGAIIRHYSLVGGPASGDDPANTYRIAVQREDRNRGSAHIHDTFDVGTRLLVSRPKNNFPLDRRDSHTVLIAGGIGITPILSMLRSLRRRNRPFTMVYAGRTTEHMAYVDEVRQLAGDRAFVHASGDPPVTHLDLEAVLLAVPTGATAYVCGPPAMIRATHAAGDALGWATDRVRSEMFSAGPTGDEVAFDVELARTGKTVRIGRDTTILDALIAAGADVLYDCRRGECGLCPLSIIAADGPIQHRDRYLSDEDHAAGDSLCICVSRVAGSRLVLDA